MSTESRVSVDLGGSSVRVAIGDGDAGIRRDRSRATGSEVGPPEVLDFVGESVAALRGGEAVRDLALGFPGLIGEGSVVLSAPNLDESWIGVALRPELERRTGMAVRVVNDARMAAMGELAFGIGRREAAVAGGTLVFIGLGTGVGGGVVIDGRIHGGRSGAAGELGHVVVERNGPLCACGGRGCVEAFAGAASLARRARRAAASGEAPSLSAWLAANDGRRPDVETMVRCAERGDESLDALLEDAARAVGVLVANLVHTLSPEAVVVGGGLSRLGDRLYGPLWEEVRDRVRMTPLDGLIIEASSLGDRAGLLGGLVLAASEAW